MLDLPDEVITLLSGKLALKYNGTDLEAMKAIATAAKKRSLADFNQTFGSYPQELQVYITFWNFLSKNGGVESNLGRLSARRARCYYTTRSKHEKQSSEIEPLSFGH